jgi:hypothetical protein
METLTNNNMSVGDIFYRKHIQRVLAYQKANAEKVNERNKKYYKKIKEENPEQYAHYLEYHRNYNKKRREEKKAEKQKMEQ